MKNAIFISCKKIKVNFNNKEEGNEGMEIITQMQYILVIFLGCSYCLMVDIENMMIFDRALNVYRKINYPLLSLIALF